MPPNEYQQKSRGSKQAQTTTTTTTTVLRPFVQDHPGEPGTHSEGDIMYRYYPHISRHGDSDSDLIES